MKHIIIITITLMLSLPLLASTTQINSLERRIEELELENMLRMFNFGAELKTQSFVINSADQDVKLNRLRANFDIHARASRNLRFYSRLTTFKYFNKGIEEDNPGNTFGPDVLGPLGPEDRSVQLSRAFFDYFVPNTELAVSIGRLPTFNGPPAHFLDNLPRQSTYPLLTYNGQVDGAAISYNFRSFMPKNYQLSARLLYTPITNVNYNNFLNPTYQPNLKPNIEDIYAAVLELEIKDKFWLFPEISLIATHLKLNGGSFANTDSYVTTGVAGTPLVEGTPYLSVPGKMFDLDLCTVYMGLNNIGSWGLDFNASVLYSIVNNRKLATINLPGVHSGEYGLISDSPGRTKGVSYLLGAKKKLILSNNLSPYLGAEFFKGNKKSLLLSVAGTLDEPTGFYATRGNAYHLFYLQPIENNLSVRVGYRHQSVKWGLQPEKTLGFGGYNLEVNQTIRNYYLNILFKI